MPPKREKCRQENRESTRRTRIKAVRVQTFSPTPSAHKRPCSILFICVHSRPFAVPLGRGLVKVGRSSANLRKTKKDAQLRLFQPGWALTLATTYSRASYTSTTIGAVAFHFRVRDGNGWDHHATVTRRWKFEPLTISNCQVSGGQNFTKNNRNTPVPRAAVAIPQPRPLSL
jgi:hypothetical protein